MPETLADLLRQVGVQPSAREQFVESTRRPGYVVPRPRPRTMRSPEDRARDPNAGVRNQAREQQRAAYASAQSQGALQSRLARSEAYDPGIDPNTGLTQGQEAILGAAEFTGAPSAFRSYDAFANGRPWEGVGHAGLGALAVLGNVGVGASPRLRPQLPRSAAFDAPTRLPVNPPREIAANGLPIRPSEPFRNSLRGGGDDLAEAAGLRPHGLDAGGGRGETLRPDLGANDRGALQRGAAIFDDGFQDSAAQQGFRRPATSMADAVEQAMAPNATRGAGVAGSYAKSLQTYLQRGDWEGFSRTVDIAAEAGPLALVRTARAFAEIDPRYAARVNDFQSVNDLASAQDFLEFVRRANDPWFAQQADMAARAARRANRSPSSGAEQTGRAATSVPAGARGSAREVLDVPLSNGRTTEVIRNPSQADLMRLSVLPRELGPETRRTAAGQLRYIQDANGDVYVFRGWDAIHDDVAGGMDRMGRRLGGYQRDDGGRTDHGRFGYLRRDGDTFVSGNGEPLSPRVQEMLAPRRVPRKPPQSKQLRPRPKAPGFFFEPSR